MIPCKVHKCILLPICKGKKEITCLDLISHCKYCYWAGKDLWPSMNKIFPNLIKVSFGLTVYYRSD